MHVPDISSRRCHLRSEYAEVVHWLFEKEEEEEEEEEEKEEEEEEEEGRGKGSSCAFLVWASSLNGPPPGVDFFVRIHSQGKHKKTNRARGFFPLLGGSKLYCSATQTVAMATKGHSNVKGA